jgi:hypothetical protein
MFRDNNKISHDTSRRKQELEGLPPLPESVAPIVGNLDLLRYARSSQSSATERNKENSENIVERLQGQPASALKPALAFIAQGGEGHNNQEKSNTRALSPSVYDRSIGIVRGLLNMYTADELDGLLLSCNKNEREVLLKTLLSRS